jgi:hypothetical protein
LFLSKSILENKDIGHGVKIILERFISLLYDLSACINKMCVVIHGNMYLQMTIKANLSKGKDAKP